MNKRLLVFILLGLATTGTKSPTCQAQDWLLTMKLRGRRIEGGPVAWSKSRVFLFGRDGHLWSFAPSEAQDFRKTSSQFRSYSQAEMRGRLQSEFGNGFQVSGTGHYLVVHPVGQKDAWAHRFEELYRSFVHYFVARGWRAPALKFPLVAVVFPRHEDFLRYAGKTGTRVSRNVLGYYSPQTNRILLYDVTAGQKASAGWHINASTIIHEATHQTAFNLGIHTRVGQSPRWVVEGLGTMFEARGVWNSGSYPNQADRINAGYLAEFKRQLSKRPRGRLATIVSSDALFRSQPNAAYAESWALTFFLIETRPREYLSFLKSTAAVDAFRPYRSDLRLQHFTAAFGTNLPMLEAHFIRYLKSL